MQRVSIRTEQVDPEAVWDSYQLVRAALFAKRDSLLEAHRQGAAMPRDPQFAWMATDEIDAHFVATLEEVDHQFCFSLIAATEAAIRVDFFDRVHHRRKDPLSRQFRLLHASTKGHKNRGIRLSKILEAWTSEFPAHAQPVGDFRGALRYRDWLAHGRYWVPKLGQKYSPHLVQKIAEDLLDVLGLA